VNPGVTKLLTQQIESRFQRFDVVHVGARRRSPCDQRAKVSDGAVEPLFVGNDDPKAHDLDLQRLHVIVDARVVLRQQCDAFDAATLRFPRPQFAF